MVKSNMFRNKLGEYPWCSFSSCSEVMLSSKLPNWSHLHTLKMLEGRTGFAWFCLFGFSSFFISAIGMKYTIWFFFRITSGEAWVFQCRIWGSSNLRILCHSLLLTDEWAMPSLPVPISNKAYILTSNFLLYVFVWVASALDEKDVIFWTF